MKYGFRLTIFYFLFICLGLHESIDAQEIEQGYFNKPLDAPLILSGTFGELRNNHFHAGIDIKTQGRIGLPVTASASGYISRIKIQEFGYGKAIYIQHPNGFQTVYAHLNNFAPAIEEYIKKQQYIKESYAIELFPNKDLFPVEQDEIIAYSGNTGSSGGPHLHFEIRDQNSKPMNPLLFGFNEITDHIKPRIKGIWAYTLNDSAQVTGLQGKKRIQLSRTQSGFYLADKVSAFGKIGFGISTDDQLDKAINRNGIYKIETFLNGSKHFEQRFDRFSFSETRYINRLVDYFYYKENKQRIQKLFLEINNPLSINSFHNQGGSILIDNEGTNFNYLIQVEDFAGNKQEIQIPIVAQKNEISQPQDHPKTPYFVQAEYGVAFEEENIDVYFPKGALYEDTYLQIEFETNAINLHDYRVPIHNAIHLGFDVSQFPVDVQDNMYVAKVMPWGTKYYTPTQKKKNRITALIKDFGRYEIAYDKDAPTITPINVRNKKWMSNYRYLKLKIDDETTGIENYRASVNGEFILMEYEYKNNMLTYDFNDGKFDDGKNEFKLIVTDKVGNTSIFEAEIFRKN
ncbi:M23 family metallopeptidase [Psychroflexus salis]|uniref:Peptidase M23 n=1 Tax=Psychroflexus salis TaxID=1526574 RepID=A0A917E970_9FLAO|nr:M23 family metallopeptidase [Psychroflexus salis]GGE16242.1 peptidase M23 [Psychroflexus salis]